MKKLFLLLLFIGVFLRVADIGDLLYQEESTWGIALRDASGYEGASAYIPHPPLGIMIFKIMTAIFGIGLIRMVPIIFGIINILLVYKIAKEHFGEKAAFYAAGLMLFSFWHFVASLQVDMEGSILTFMLIMTFWAYLKYTDSKQGKWLVITSILFGLSLLTKITAVLIIPIIGLHSLLARRNIIDSAKELLPICAIGGFLFIAWAGASYFFQRAIFDNVFGHAASATYTSGMRVFSLLPMVYFLLWSTPLFSLLLIHSFFSGNGLNKNDKNSSNKKYFFQIWAILPIIAYMFIGEDFIATYDRYLMITIPALAILGGFVISSFKLEKKDYYFGGIIFLLSIIGAFMLNIYADRVAHSFGTYFRLALAFKWNFLLPISSSTGPTIAASFMAVALSFILCTILAALSVKAKSAKFFAAFIAIALGLNVFLITEQAFPLTQPDVSYTMKELFNYARENNAGQPIMSNMFATAFYLSDIRSRDDMYGFDYLSKAEQARDTISRLQPEKGIILALDYPLLDKAGGLWQELNRCSLKQEIISKGIKSGYIFQC